MTKRPRRNHIPAFKAKVALAAFRCEKTLTELAEQLDVHANQITPWRTQLLEGAAEVFGGDGKTESPPPIDVKEFHARIGGLTLTIDFLAGALTKAGLLSASDDRPCLALGAVLIVCFLAAWIGGIPL